MKNLTPVAQKMMSKDIWIEAIHSEPDLVTDKNGALFEINLGNTHIHRFKKAEISRTGGDEEQSYILHQNGLYYFLDISLDQLSEKLDNLTVKAGVNSLSLKGESSFSRFSSEDFLISEEILDIFKFKKAEQIKISFNYTRCYKKDHYCLEKAIFSNPSGVLIENNTDFANYNILGCYTLVIDSDEAVNLFKAAQKLGIEEIQYTERTRHSAIYYGNNKQMLPPKSKRAFRCKATQFNQNIIDNKTTAAKESIAKMVVPTRMDFKS